MRAALDLFYRLLQILITGLMGLLIVPVVLQIASRFTEAIPRYIWTEEVARFSFIWIIMLGSIVAVRDGTHFDLDLWRKPKTARGAALGRLLTHALMLLMALTFVWFGYGFALFGFDQESELTGLNMLAIHIAWPLAGFGYILFLGEKLWADVALFRGGDRPRA
jgi:TRAP-type C4-dicarboxylate transport system permease small subunit